MDVKGVSAKCRLSPSRTRCWSGRWGWRICCCKAAQAHFGVSPSAHFVAASLWLHKLSMTDGNFVNTIPVDGVCKVVLYIGWCRGRGWWAACGDHESSWGPATRVLEEERVFVLVWLSKRSELGRWHWSRKNVEVLQGCWQGVEWNSITLHSPPRVPPNIPRTTVYTLHTTFCTELPTAHATGCNGAVTEEKLAISLVLCFFVWCAFGRVDRIRFRLRNLHAVHRLAISFLFSSLVLWFLWLLGLSWFILFI